MIHYTCDDCGQDVYEAEAIGPGVFQFFDGHPAMGKPYEYEADDTDLTLTIHLGSRNNNHQHFCFACLWKTVHAMVLKYSPFTGITIGETAGWPSEPFIAKVNPTPTSEPRLAVVKDEEEDEDGDKYRRVMLCKNIDEVKEVLAEIEAEKNRDVEVEVPNEEVDHGTKNADTQLSAMHAEGVLSETGADVDADDEGPWNRDVPRIPNFDDDAHPGRIDYTSWPIHRVRNGPGQSRGRS